MISHATPLLMLGSCFATNIGERLRRDLLDVCVNPFGTLYNPASIAYACRRIATGKHFTEEDITERDGWLHSWHCHSSHSSRNLDREAYLAALNGKIERFHSKFRNVRTAILTFGTRHVYSLKANGMVVANCHKFPAADFVGKDLTVEECATLITDAIESLRGLNTEMKIVLTVSPVRYVGEGLHKSTLSKSVLLLACEEIERKMNDVIYFPSYEIMMDDLRDYRFYAADMKHPSDVAVDYIYSLFSESFLDKKTVLTAAECRRLTSRLAHRSLSGQVDEVFKRQTAEMADKLIALYPELTKTVNKLLER